MSEEQSSKQAVDEKRREFLRKSIYAAYATPVITALLVSKASAAISQASCTPPTGKWYAPGNCCDTGPRDSCGPNG